MTILETLFGKPIPSLIPVEARARLKEHHPPFLLDVREPGEVQRGHIVGARLFPVGALGSRLGELPEIFRNTYTPYSDGAGIPFLIKDPCNIADRVPTGQLTFQSFHDTIRSNYELLQQP